MTNKKVSPNRRERVKTVFNAGGLVVKFCETNGFFRLKFIQNGRTFVTEKFTDQIHYSTAHSDCVGPLSYDALATAFTTQVDPGAPRATVFYGDGPDYQGDRMVFTLCNGKIETQEIKEWKCHFRDCALACDRRAQSAR